MQLSLDLPMCEGVSEAFTPEQAAAIARREERLIVTANAGSGKTRVLTERFVRSCIDDGIDPAAILAITFTEKAAGELRERVRVALRRARPPRPRAGDRGGVGLDDPRLLHAGAEGERVTAGLDPASRSSTRATPARCAPTRSSARWPAGWATAGETRAGALDVAAAYGVDNLRKLICAVHDRLRSQGEVAPSLPPARPRPTSTRCDPASRPRSRPRWRRSERRQQDERGGRSTRCTAVATPSRPADGRCLQGRPRRRRAQGPGVRRVPPGASRLRAGHRRRRGRAGLGAARRAARALRRRVRAGQARAVGGRLRRPRALRARSARRRRRDPRALRGALRADHGRRVPGHEPAPAPAPDLLGTERTFYVGDAQQSIYRFRHASVELFAQLADELDAAGQAEQLATNFRTRGPILEAINAAFGERTVRPARRRPRGAGAGGPLVELLLTDSEGWDDVELGALPAGKADRCAEARLVAQRVRELVDAGECAAGDVCVLLRASTDMETFERALEDQGFATLASGGRGFWARQQVLDLTSYVAALVNPRDEEALLAVLASPIAGVELRRAGAARPRGAGRRRRRCGTPSRRPGASLADFCGWFAGRARAGAAAVARRAARARDRAHALRRARAAAAGRAAASGQRDEADPAGRGVRGAGRAVTRAASSTAPAPSSRPRRASPTRRSSSRDWTPCG